MVMSNSGLGARPPLDELVAMYEALIGEQSYTTHAGNAAGTSIIDSSLIGLGAGAFNNMLIVLYPGQPSKVDGMTTVSLNNATGEVTLSRAYKGVAAAIPAGVPYIILPLSISVSGVIADLNVPPVNSAANVLERDVIGQKGDTVAGNSLYSLLLQALAAFSGLVSITALQVPAQNSAANVLERDVIGNKTDTTAGTSIVSLILQAQALIPAAVKTSLDTVYFDSVNGHAGVVYPRGTAQDPVNDLTDALAIMAAWDSHKLELVGASTLTVGGVLNVSMKIIGNPLATISVSAVTATLVAQGDLVVGTINNAGSLTVWGNLWVDTISSTGSSSTTISGDTYVALSVSNDAGTTDLGGDLHLVGSLSNGAGIIGISGYTYISGAITGNAGTIDCYGNADILGTITNGGNITISGELNCSNISNTSSIIVGGDIYSTGSITMATNSSISAFNLTCEGIFGADVDAISITILNDCMLQNSLVLGGGISSTMAVTGQLSIISANLAVSAGAVLGVGGPLYVSGNITNDGTISANGPSVNAGGNITNQGVGSFNAAGTVTCGANLTNSGAASFVSIIETTLVYGNLDNSSTGSISIYGDCTVWGTTTVAAGGTITIAGLGTLWGTITNSGTLTYHAPALATMDLWSAYLAQAVVTVPVTAHLGLPSIIIAGLPAGATIVRAIMFFKCRTIENTNALVNSVSGPQNIQCQKDVGGTLTPGIVLAGGEFSVPITTRENGDVMMGTTDVSAQVPANGAQMDFEWTAALAAQVQLNFNDIQIGLRIWYQV